MTGAELVVLEEKIVDWMFLVAALALEACLDPRADAGEIALAVGLPDLARQYSHDD